MSSCDYDCIDPFAYWVRNVTARKPHVCCECGSTIDPGETYTIRSGIWDGEFSTFKHCDLCSRAWDHLRNEVDHDVCVPLGCLWDWIYDLQKEKRHAAV